jgi:hypothetical protein
MRATYLFEVASSIEDQMARLKLTKTVIDALPTPSNDIVHWTGCRGLGVKITP